MTLFYVNFDDDSDVTQINASIERNGSWVVLTPCKSANVIYVHNPGHYASPSVKNSGFKLCMLLGLRPGPTARTVL